MDNKWIHLKYILKESKIVRLLVHPLINSRRRKQTMKYLNSIDSKRIKSLKNIYKGERCFIVCNGPSLKIEQIERLEQIKGMITFGLNRVYYLYDKTKWRPDYYVAFEPEFVSKEISTIENIEVKRNRFINIIGKNKKNDLDKKNIWLNCTSKFTIDKYSTDNIYFSDEIEKEVIDAYTVTFTALQIAIYMGFSEINLIGADHQFSKVITKNNKLIENNKVVGHCYIDKKEDYRTYSFLEGIEMSYKVAKKYAEEHEILIQNLTEGGKLEIFRRKDFDLYIKEQESNG